jgi:hypothetical protein
MHSHSRKQLLLLLAMFLISFHSYSQTDVLIAQVRTQVVGRQLLDLSQFFRSEINAQDVERVVIIGSSQSYSTRLELAIDQQPTGIATIMQGFEKDILQPPQYAWGRLQLIVHGQAMIDRIKIKLKPIMQPPVGGGMGGRPDLIQIPLRVRTRTHSDMVRIDHLLPYHAIGARLMRVEVRATSIDRMNSVQLIINNQLVDRTLSADPRGMMVLRFDTGMFKGGLIGHQIRSIALATRGMIDVQEVALRVVQSHDNGYGNGQGMGHGGGQGIGHGGGNGIGHGGSQGHGHGGGQGIGHGSGHGGGQGIGQGGGSGQISNVINLAINRQLVDKEKVSIASLITPNIQVPSNRVLKSIEIVASSNITNARLALKGDTGVIGNVVIQGRTQKAIDVNQLVNLSTLELVAREVMVLEQVKLTFE